MKVFRYASWLTWEARWIWGWVVPVVVALPFGLYLPCTQAAAAIVAAVLQFAGLVVAFVGLAGDAKTFGKSLSEPFVNWWNLRPGKLRRVSATATINVEAGAAGFSLSRAKSTATDVQGRLKWLEEKVYAIQEQADTTAHSLRILTAETARSIENERQQRQASHGELRKQLVDHAAGGIHLNVVALWWVFVGTALGLWVSLAT